MGAAGRVAGTGLLTSGFILGSCPATRGCRGPGPAPHLGAELRNLPRGHCAQRSLVPRGHRPSPALLAALLPPQGKAAPCPTSRPGPRALGGSTVYTFEAPKSPPPPCCVHLSAAPPEHSEVGSVLGGQGAPPPPHAGTGRVPCVTKSRARQAGAPPEMCLFGNSPASLFLVTPFPSSCSRGPRPAGVPPAGGNGHGAQPRAAAPLSPSGIPAPVPLPPSGNPASVPLSPSGIPAPERF